MKYIDYYQNIVIAIDFDFQYGIMGTDKVLAISIIYKKEYH